MKEYTPPSDPKDIYTYPWGHQLKYYRERRGITQDEIGKIKLDDDEVVYPNGNVSVSNIERLQVTKKPPPLKKVKAISQYLHLSVEENYNFIHTARKECAPKKINEFDQEIGKIKTEMMLIKKGVSREMKNCVVLLQDKSPEDLEYIAQFIRRCFPEGGQEKS